MDSNATADSWFYLSRHEFNELLSTNHRKWTNLSVDQLQSLYDEAPNIKWYNDMMRISAITICSVGTFSCVNSLMALWKKTFQERNLFFAVMFIISCIDLLFNIGFILYSVYYRSFKKYGSDSFTAMWCMLVARSCVYFLSLVSDMFALTLTFQRCVALCWPHKMKHFSKATSKVCQAILIISLSLTRIHYSLTYVVVENPYRNMSVTSRMYMYTRSPSTSEAPAMMLSFFSDMILPFVLVILMATFSSKIIIVLLRRNKKRMESLARKAHFANSSAGVEISAVTTTFSTSVISASQIENEKLQAKDQADTMVTLVLVLDFLFILNQLGYCAFAVVEALIGIFPTVNFKSDYGQALFWCRLQKADYIIAFLCVTIECFSHSVNFFLYFQFSSSFRKEYKRFICGIGNAVKDAMKQ